MHVVTHLPGEGEAARIQALALLDVLASIWAWQFRNVPGSRLPPLYSTTVRYQEEPNSGSGLEQFDSPWQVIQRGHGDCDDLVGWRVAELRAQGRRARVEIIKERNGKRMHAIVLTERGREDPSREMLRRESIRKQQGK